MRGRKETQIESKKSITKGRAYVNLGAYISFVFRTVAFFPSSLFQADAELGPAEAEESRAKDAYSKACASGAASSSSSSSAAPVATEDPYAYLKPAADAAPPADDDFM